MEKLTLQHSILETLPESLRRDALNGLQAIQFEHGKVLFRAGDPCQGLPLVLHGSVKVQMTGLSGNSIVLYRMGADDICTLSIGCLMTGDGFRAEAVVEEDAKVLMVPRGLFDRLMDQSADFRLGIMESYGRRLNDLMLLVEEVAFRRMDERLLHWLEARAGQRAITITHQELAIELGTAREVVSRLLKELERKGRLRLARGKIEFTGSFAE
ncbi:Crp/Fnr family transcriptional regulator [Marinobacter adhaerens]|jgi:CRP/FNR family transcriptional regulator|uniref:Crp/Fnr family transcriptional regulator n=2 Tax=Marinobacter adhaerens TaxID=1033846 RepID=A0ABX8INI9_9GAMM|nr:Crp/Fnr family transcriptional regulator [Marinobacter adhaerens]ADP96844.1 transcriptional Regulator, Crp/Fnr family protein [Marinobacter adhaerens HP15]MBW4979798.1 Crp/Fnr family transcriptional regulator [Marinobacter adhaerens]QWV14804.1 Crp/Fnr family transcriptional regulator [Marinobacter adhaerens]